MSRIKWVILLFLIVGYVQAKEERPQFRIWKSSNLQGGNYGPTLISSSPIIFHMVTGSGTINIGGNSYFTVFNSTGPATAGMQSDASTQAVIPLNSSPGQNSGIGIEQNVFCSSSAYFIKQGAANPINYLWDFYNQTQFNRNPNE